MGTKISCVIPVYNEAKTVSGVLDAVTGHPLVDEVIVVDDGSTDNSKSILEKRRDIRLISYQKNQGKSFAVMTGLKETKNDLVMLLDSDLINLNRDNVTALISPVITGETDITLSMRKNSLLIFKIFGLDFVSGERVFSKKIIPDLNQLAHLPGFGLETFLNQIIIGKELRLKSVKWNNVMITRKSKKVGWWKGVKGDYFMIMQILSMLKLSGLISHFHKMRKLRKK